MKLAWVSFIFFAIAAIVHFSFFILESILFQKPNGYKLFKLKESDHEPVKIWALNQGFYNLFLALGMVVGLYFVIIGRRESAGVLVGFSGLSMIGAGIVLLFTSPNTRRGALLQILPPAIGFFFLLFHILSVYNVIQ